MKWKYTAPMQKPRHTELFINGGAALIILKGCLGVAETASYKPTPMLQDRLEQMQLYDVHIFNTPFICRGKRTFPDDYAALRHDEEVLGFTLDNKRTLMNL